MRMAWCVGSVFPNLDLLTGRVFDSPLLDARDPPQHLLDTGCEFRYETYPEADPHHQVDDFLEKYKEAFFPKDLLSGNLQEDVQLHAECPQSSFNAGNRLEGIENREGTLQLFFPVGENIDRIGSCLLSSELNSSIKIHNSRGTDILYSSPSVCQPILQIAANKVESSQGSTLACVPLVVRTPYQVHLLTSRLQNEDISLLSGGVHTFDYSTSHVVWNPHLPGEAAVILSNGDVNILDFSSGRTVVACSSLKMQDCRTMDNFGHSHYTLCQKAKRRKFREPRSSVNNWWSCEYAWHPRNLLVGGDTQIDLVDLRQKAGSKSFHCSLAIAPSSTRLFSYCRGLYGTEHFTALVRGTHDDIFQFAAASTNHLILYDVRQPKIPLLQWEHRMQLELPRLLQISYFSDTRPRLWSSPDNHLAGGRVILACAFRSGKIQAFPYGPQPRTHSQNAERHMGDVGISEKLFSWEFPLKLTSQKVYSDNDIERSFEAHGSNMQALLPKDCEVERLVGLFNPPSYPGSSSFTLLQLTGSGAILSQSLHVLEEQGLSSTFQRSLPLSKKVTSVRTTSGKLGTKHYRMDFMPAFFKHVIDVTVLPELRQRVTAPTSKELSKNDDPKEELQMEPGDCSPLFIRGHGRVITSLNSQDEVTARSHDAPTPEKLDNSQFQCGKLGNEGDQSTEDFFRDVDSQCIPVQLYFEGTGATLQSEEKVLLNGLKNLLQQWQETFQPYIDNSKLDVKKTTRV